MGEFYVGKKSAYLKYFLVILLGTLLSTVASAQPWTYNFGTAASSGYTTLNTPSTSYLPVPASGTARVRNANSSGASTNLDNPGLAILGSDAELRITNPTASSASASKFSIYDYGSGKVGSIKFSIVLGGSATSGQTFFAFGDGAFYSDNNQINATALGVSFGAIRWTWGSGTSITTNINAGGSLNWVATGITGPGTAFVKGSKHNVEIYFNNTTGNLTYDRGGLQNIAVNKWDLWVDGNLIGDELLKAGLSGDVAIDSWAFHCESTQNAAITYLDDIEYSNVLPVATCTAPTLQASGLSFSNIGTNSMDLNWTNGNGAGRVVIMNTSNSFTAPSTGANPTANLAYAGSGEQVIYNGTGSGPITVTGLTASTTYWYRVYEYCTSGRTYQSATATGNPNSQVTTANTTPTLTATALTSFGTQCINNVYGPNSFTISGSSLTTANISIGALAGFSYSETATGTYTSTLDFTQPGGTLSKDIYVKFSPVAATVYSGNIPVSGGGAASINVAATGTGINTAPAVTTTVASAITVSGGSSGGASLTSACGTVTAKGVVWGTAANPTVPSVNSTNNGTGTANFTSTISGLASNTTYHYRAYVTNSNGVTSYGTNLTFTTLKDEPTNQATSLSCGNNTSSSLRLTWIDGVGTTVPDGYLIKWNSTGYGSIADPADGTVEPDGTTTQNITAGSQVFNVIGLAASTTYYFKVYAYSNSGSNINYKLVSVPQTSCATSAGPCLFEDFSAGVLPTGWNTTATGGSVTFSSNYADLAASTATLTTIALSNPSSLTFALSRTNNATAKTLLVEISTTSQTAGFATIATYDHNNTISAGTINPTIDLSAYAGSPSVFIRFNKTTGNTSPWRIDDISVFCGPATPIPEINIKQGSVSIQSGTGSFDFGTQQVSTSSAATSFTIENLGTATLNITGTPKIAISGTNAADFTINQTSTTDTVSAAGTTAFSITYTPSGTGARTATISIANNDADENPYTFTVTGLGSFATTSTLVENNTDYNAGIPASKINYLSYQATPAIGQSVTGTIGAMRLVMSDGYGDGQPTTLTNLNLTVKNEVGVNQVGQIRHAVLAIGNSIRAVATITGTELQFSGLSAADFFAAESVTPVPLVMILRVSYKSSPITDNTKFVFKVSTATAATTGSVFSTVDAGGAFTDGSTGNNLNRINVQADRLRLTVQPIGQSVNTPLPSFTVSAVDVNANIDFDATNSFALTTSGINMSSSSPYTLVAGVRNITDVQFATIQTGITLTATTTGLANDNDDESTAFNISDVTNGTYRTLTAGTWPSGTATWERFNAGWAPSSAPSPATTDLLIISKTVTTTAAFSASGGIGTKLTVENGGTFNDGHNSTFSDLNIKSGGKFIISDPAVDIIASSGKVTVESGGTVTANSSTFNNADGFWQGIENFKAGSIFEIANWDVTNAGQDLIDNSNVLTLNTDGYYFGNIVFNATLSNSFTFVGIIGSHKLCYNDLTVTNGNSSNSVILTNVNAAVEIGGNLSANQNQFSMGSVTSANVIHTVKGNMTANGGTINLNQNNSASASVTVNLEGNLSVIATSSLTSTDGGCKIVFNKAGLQTASVAGTLGTNAAFEVAAGSTTRLIGQNFPLSNASNKFTVLANGILEFNNFDLVGLGDFELQASGTIRITSSDGVNATPLNTGNVRNTGTRTFAQAGYYHYVGAASPQSTGTAMQNAASTAKRIIIEKTNLSDIVNLTQSTATTGQLNIISGTFAESASSVVTGGGDLIMSGGIYKIAVLNTALPQLGGSYNLTGSSTIDLTGAGDQVLKGSKAYRNITFSTSGNKTVSSAPASVTGTITVANDAVFNASIHTVGGSGTNLTMTGNSRYITDGGGTKPDASGAYNLGPNTTIEFANTSGAGIIKTTTAPTYYANVVVSGDNVGTAVATGVRFQTGGTFLIKTGAIFKVNNTTGFSGQTSTAIDITNTPAITLENNSTVQYNAAGPQPITNLNVTSPANTNYMNLVLAGSGNKTAPTGTLSIAGNLSKIAGTTFVNNGGTVAFNGSTQTISSVGSTFEFNNLTSNSSVALNIGSDIGIGRELTLGAGSNLALSTAANISLRSRSTQTANVAALGAGANISYPGTGRFIVERYIASGRRWRLLAAPIADEASLTQTIRDSWQEGATTGAQNPAPGFGMQVTDFEDNWLSRGFDNKSLGGPSVKLWQPGSGTYKGVASTGIKIATEHGYMAFVRGNRVQTTGNATVDSTILRTKGKLKVGTQGPYNITQNQFETFGNPYASAIDLRNISLNSTNLTSEVYVWDPKLTNSTYSAYGLGAFQTLTRTGVPGSSYIAVPGLGSYTDPSVNPNFIQSGQAFFVKALPAATGTVTFGESSKTSGSAEVFFAPEQSQLLRANLFLPSTQEPILIDGVLAIFGDDNNNAADFNDAAKMLNTGENVSFTNDSKLLSVERRAIPADTDTLFINFTSPRYQAYRWQLDLQNMDAPGRSAFLRDTYLQQTKNLNMAGVTDYDFSVTADAGSYNPNRFYIYFKQQAAGPLPVTLTHIAATRNTDQKTITVSWKTENEISMARYEIERSANGNDFTTIGTATPRMNNGGATTYSFVDNDPLSFDNFYRIKAVSLDGRRQMSNIAKVDALKSASSITVYPNPVKNKNLQLKFTNQPEGNYTIQLFNKAGQLISNSSISITAASQVKSIKLDPFVAAGNYQLLVVDGAGKSQAVQVVVE